MKNQPKRVLFGGQWRWQLLTKVNVQDYMQSFMSEATKQPPHKAVFLRLMLEYLEVTRESTHWRKQTFYALVFGHIGQLTIYSLSPDKQTLSTTRTFGAPPLDA